MTPERMSITIASCRPAPLLSTTPSPTVTAARPPDGLPLIIGNRIHVVNPPASRMCPVARRISCFDSVPPSLIGTKFLILNRTHLLCPARKTRAHPFNKTATIYSDYKGTYNFVKSGYPGISVGFFMDLYKRKTHSRRHFPGIAEGIMRRCRLPLPCTPAMTCSRALF
jgi:hypothetical protein